MQVQVEKINKSVVALKERAAQVRALYKEVLREGEHYGVFFQGQSKPALLKSGAEKLLSLFRLGIRPVIEKNQITDGSETIGMEYICKAEVFQIDNGVVWGTGIGQSSTMEEKFRWRRATCIEEFNATSSHLKREKWFRAESGKPPFSVQQVAINYFDITNTVMKMAKKRAIVDAALTVLGVSDIFSQDTEEDVVGEIIEAHITPLKKAEASHDVPQTEPKPSPKPTSSPADNNGLSSFGLSTKIKDGLEIVVGNAYEYRTQIKAIGFKWNPEEKIWVRPAVAA